MKLISKNKKRRAFFYFSWDFPQNFKFLIFCNLNFVEINFLFWKLRAPWGPGSPKISSPPPRPQRGRAPWGRWAQALGDPDRPPCPQNPRGPGAPLNDGPRAWAHRPRELSALWGPGAPGNFWALRPPDAQGPKTFRGPTAPWGAMGPGLGPLFIFLKIRNSRK